LYLFSASCRQDCCCSALFCSNSACEIAGVEPKFQKINGQDQKAYVLSVNINRLHMTAGARAMAVAMMYPDAGGKGGLGKKDDAKNLQLSGGFSVERLRQARAVLAHSPPIASAVLAGSKSLDEAYHEASLRLARNVRLV
jgi:hypothetical protein